MFGRKKKAQMEQTKQQTTKECDHKWEDFDWYIDFDIVGKILCYSIYEPYVCIHCKKRKDIRLEGPMKVSLTSNSEAWKELRRLRETYPKIKDRAIVEDEINDAQLVDREYIRIAKWLQGTHVPINNIILKIENSNDGQPSG